MELPHKEEFSAFAATARFLAPFLTKEENMTWILEAAAILCLIYYGIIVLYSGITTSFALCWPVFAICLVLLAAAIHYQRRYYDMIPLWITTSVATAVGAIITIFVLVELLIGWGAVSSTRQTMDYVIVLGAKVDGTRISNSLKKRLNKALEYAENNPNTTLVLSGGQGQDEGNSEARVMYEYLLLNGIPKEQLLMEDKSRNTKENIIFSKEVIDRQEKWREKLLKRELQDSYRGRPAGDTVKIGVLTSNFHVFRAKEIAKKQGIPNVYGISAQSDPVLGVHFWIRECFAVLKDKFMGNM